MPTAQSRNHTPGRDKLRNRLLVGRDRSILVSTLAVKRVARSRRHGRK